LVKATYKSIATTKASRIAMLQSLHYCRPIARKLNIILKLTVAMLNENNVTFVANSFVANCVSYISA